MTASTLTFRLAAATTAASALILAGCAPATLSSDRPHLVVTTNILGDVVSEVAGDAADVTVLMRPNADPHSFEISAQEAAMLADADLLVSNGLGLEENVELHLATAASAGAMRFVAGDHIEVIEYASDEASGPDPHFWTDPGRIVDVVVALEEQLTAMPEIDSATIEQNAAAYLAEIEQLDAEMTESFASIPRENRALVTNHHVFGYLADRFDFTTVGTVIPGAQRLPLRPPRTSTASRRRSRRRASRRSSRSPRNRIV
ncbi:metal ABC transporter solute-binding protein, Zn/Mn family [Microbacterium amylolyticum]|uniref:metal ABC transporter solute-binding protein, Zn/Mn family n=1 Tax=Microbacterium amylolyticum TaxID=936337 RepID=UPI00360ADED4